MNPTEAMTALPPMPYTVKLLRYGPGEGVARATKVYPHGGGDLLTPDEIAVWEYVKALEERVAKLQAFKDYVHKRMDDAGVPATLPDSPHTAAGCRIGGRLDLVLSAYLLVVEDEKSADPAPTSISDVREQVTPGVVEDVMDRAGPARKPPATHKGKK